MKFINRRIFFSKLSIGAVGAFLLSNLPFKIFSKPLNKNAGHVTVKIHPNSVKRNK